MKTCPLKRFSNFFFFFLKEKKNGELHEICQNGTCSGKRKNCRKKSRIILFGSKKSETTKLYTSVGTVVVKLTVLGLNTSIMHHTTGVKAVARYLPDASAV